MEKKNVIKRMRDEIAIYFSHFFQKPQCKEIKRIIFFFFKKNFFLIFIFFYFFFC
jgi:hypothetical protein